MATTPSPSDLFASSTSATSSASFFSSPTSDTPTPTPTPTSSSLFSSALSTAIFSSDPVTTVTPTSPPSIESIASTPPAITEVVVGTSEAPTSVVAVTSIINIAPSSNPGATTPVVVTRVSTAPVPVATTRTAAAVSSASASSTGAATLQSNGKNGDTSSGPLSPGAKVAIAVVIPIVVIALLVLAGVFWWRKRKQKKVVKETRQREVEEYGYNPNNDPTLPAVGTVNSHSPEMTEDGGGYRGWGNNANAGSARKPSTGLSSGNGIGVAVSDDGTHPSAGSPGHPTSEGGHSAEPLVDGNNGLNGAMNGGAMAAGAGAGAGAGAAAADANLNRGPSNASSSYSAGGTDNSDDPPTHDHGYDTNYSQYTPYRPGAANLDDTTQPVIQDVSARRNTRIESPSVLPKPGNSGIAANF